jgi:hypothetical protein
MMKIWEWTKAFGRFWYGFVIGDDPVPAAIVVVMLGAVYGLLRLDVTAYWPGPVFVAVAVATGVVRGHRRKRAGG